MASDPIRDPVANHLLTPQNAAMFLLQRDWAREKTVADVVEIVLTERMLRA